MFDKIKDFFENAVDAAKDMFGLSKPREDLFAGPMTDDDWAFADEHVNHIFDVIKPQIRNHINACGVSPTLDDIVHMAEECMDSIRWEGNRFKEYLLFKRIGGREKYYALIRERIEPLTTPYIAAYLTELKSREILAPSVEAVVTAQLNELKVDYKIVKQKLRLVVEIKDKNCIPRTYYIYYRQFMKDPRISRYIQL